MQTRPALARRSPQRDRGIVTWLERRHRVERRGEGQWLSGFDRDVADVRRVDRFNAALPEDIADDSRNQILGDIVEDLVLEALLDDARRRLAWTEARDFRRARVTSRDTLDLGVHHIAGNFDAHVLARFIDVDELSLHLEVGDLMIW